MKQVRSSGSALESSQDQSDSDIKPPPVTSLVNTVAQPGAPAQSFADINNSKFVLTTGPYTARELSILTRGTLPFLFLFVSSSLP